MASNGDALAAGALRNMERDAMREQTGKRRSVTVPSRKKLRSGKESKRSPIEHALETNQIASDKQMKAQTISQNPSLGLPSDVHLGPVPVLDTHYELKWQAEDQALYSTPEHVHSREARLNDRSFHSSSSSSSSSSSYHSSSSSRSNSRSKSRSNSRSNARSTSGSRRSVHAQKHLMVGELVEVTGRDGKGKSWDGGTAKLLAIHEDTMDVKYIIGGKGNKIPNIFIRRFGTDPIEISMEDMEKAHS